MFEPRLALASLSGSSDSAWARAGVPMAGAAFIGGIAVCEQTREAAKAMAQRDREEFLPDNPIAFIERQLGALEGVKIRAGVNVRSIDTTATRRVANLCAAHDAIYEVNAHCRQIEMCSVGAGETLLTDPDALVEQVKTASSTGVDVSVKVRAEIPEVDLVEIAQLIETAGGGAIHVDAMDTRDIVRDIVDATDLFVIANNGIRSRADVGEYMSYGADAVSVGRASDRPVVLKRIADAIGASDDVIGDEARVPNRNDR